MLASPRLRSALVVTFLVCAAGCDSFDFGRVTGDRKPVEAKQVAVPPPAASAAAVKAAPTGPVTVVLGGDVAFTGAVRGALANNPSFDPLAGVRSLFDGADAVEARLVTPLSATPAPKGALPFAPPSGADALARSPIRVADVGSLSLFAGGSTAFIDTLAALTRVKLQVVGANLTAKAARPGTFAARGTAIAFVASGASPEVTVPGLHTSPVTSPAARTLDTVVEAKKSTALVVASANDLPTDGTAPSAAMREAAAALASAGATIVVFHGARVPLGVEWRGETPVFYGLGPLTGDADPKDPWTGRGLVAKVVLSAARVETVDLCPMLLVNGEPKLLAGPSRATEEGIFRRALVRLSEPLGGITLGEPDVNSCFRVGRAAAPAPSATP